MWIIPKKILILSYHKSCIKLLSTSCFLCKTHYEILGVERSATRREIRKAFIQKSRELHPDKNQNENTTQEEIHAEYVKVTEAYEILSNNSSRRKYNQTLADEASDDVLRRYQQRRQPFSDLSHMTPEERAEAMGYHVDPNWQYGKDIYIVAGLCVFIAVAGFIIHYNIAMMTYENHNAAMKKVSDEIESEIEEVRRKAAISIPGYDGNVSLRNWIVKVDGEDGNLLKKYEEQRAKVMERRERRAEQIRKIELEKEQQKLES